MILPKKSRQKLKSPRGQILILFLLILVVGLAVVLSVASRTVTDIRITTTSDESNRAYFAAEAAIEEALKQVSTSGVPGSTFDLAFTENNSSATVAITQDASAAEFVYPTEIKKDGVAQIALLDNFSPPNQANLNGTAWAGNSLTFYWGDGSGTPPALEISIVYATKPGPTNWLIERGNIRKVIFRPGSGPCFNKVSSVSNSFGTPGYNFSTVYQAELTINSAAGCNNINIGGSFKPVMARVRTLYNSSPLAVEGNVPLPPQGFTIDSSGRTPSGVTRRIEVARLYSSVSPLFDYVLFNGSTTNPLEK